MWKSVTILMLAACGSSAPTKTTVSGSGGVSGSLAKDTLRAARLVYERSGAAWDVHCDGKILGKRTWEGGPLVPIGACGLADPLYTMVIAGQLAEDVIAIDRDTVARWNPELSGIMVFKGGNELRTIPVTGSLSIGALAIDGDAIVAVVRRQDTPQPSESIAGTTLPTALAALVRIEGDNKVTTHQLVEWRGRGPGVDPSFVASGPERMVLANKSGGIVACDYKLVCDAVRSVPQAGDANGGIATQDGGLVLYHHDHSVSGINPRGVHVWTTKLAAYGIFGATDREVWVSEMVDLRRPLGIRALSLADGTPVAFRATVRTERRDPLGRFLEIHAVAATPVGPVARGIFGGSLRNGEDEGALETERVRASCYWETWHEGQEIPVPFDAKCDERFSKAIETKHVPFVATNVSILRQ